MSDLLARLRQETKALHTQTEQLFYAESLQAGTLLAEEYLHLLRTHLIFHQALETAIDRTLISSGTMLPKPAEKRPGYAKTYQI